MSVIDWSENSASPAINETYFQVPERRWLETVSLGRIAASERPPRIPRAMVNKIAVKLRAGVDAIDVVDEFDVRGFDRGNRGALRRGWHSLKAVQHMYPGQSEQIWAARDGAVVGPFELKERNHIQNESELWPLLHVVRVGKKWPRSRMLPTWTAVRSAQARSS